MSISIYLYFKGNCGAALDHYKAVFEAEELCRQTYAEGPPETFGKDDPDLIMHATLKVGSTMLMASDRASSCDEPLVHGNNFAVLYRPESRAQADASFPRLADGGEITMELQETFWGSYFGMCTDRFGVHWKFNLPVD